MTKVTINVVAKHAGVSKKTVSRVLNHEPNVKESTRQKVQAAFEELGFRPSPAARALATNQSFLIGMIYDNPNKSYVSDIQNGALSVCRRLGYHLIIHPLAFESEDLLDNISRFVVDSRLDGLVLTPPFSDFLPLLEHLASLNIRTVRIGATITQATLSENSVPGFAEATTSFLKFLPSRNSLQTLLSLQHWAPNIVSNDEESAYQVTEYLIRLGHADIAFIKGHADHPVSYLRLRGFKRAMQTHQLLLKPGWILDGQFDFESGEVAGDKLLNANTRPSAIFASNDYMAAGVLKVASQLGIDVPQQLSIVGFDNAPISGYLWPSLTTVKQPIYEMAAKAMSVLLKPDISDQDSIILESRLICRESTNKRHD